jgi:hypothetical protein
MKGKIPLRVIYLRAVASNAAKAPRARGCGIETDQRKGSDYGRRKGRCHPLNRGCKQTEFMIRS